MEMLFTYTNEIQAIPLIRKDLEELAQKWQWPGSELKQILLTVEELFSTSIRYAFKDKAVHEILFKMSMIDRTVVVEMIDDGIPFNPMEYNPDIQSDPAAQDEGGMGRMLIKAFTDSSEYQRKGTENHLIIRKTIKSNSEEDA